MRITPIGYGRSRICAGCDQWTLKAFDKWRCCEATGKRVELDPDVMNDGECPLKKWADAEPFDLQTAGEAARDRTIAKAAKNAVALLKAFDAGIPAERADICARLAVLVASGNLPARAGEALATELAKGEKGDE